MPSFSAGSAVTTIFVCTTCRRGTEALEPLEGRSGFRLHALLSEALTAGAAGHGLQGLPVGCLSHWSAGCNGPFAAPGKWTYVIGNLDPEVHLADIVTFAEQHRSDPEGVPVWRDRPESVRKGVAARVPPLASAASPEEGRTVSY